MKAIFIVTITAFTMFMGIATFMTNPQASKGLKEASEILVKPFNR